MKQFKCLYLIILLGYFSGCKNPASNVAVFKEDTSSVFDTLQLSGANVVVNWGRNKLPTEVYPLDEEELKDGYAINYNDKGELSTLSEWQKGVLEGNTFVLEKGELSTHHLYEMGKLRYQGIYKYRIKIANELYPQFVEEFFFEDKYYAKIRFPFSYEGEIQVTVKGYQSVISFLPDQTFQLVVNDALDLSRYDLLLTYHPAKKDTLLAAEYLLSHVVFDK